MAGEFSIDKFRNMGGLMLLIAGKVESGRICEGDVGKTFSGKKLAVVKIEKREARKFKALKKERVNILVKYISTRDIKVGQFLYF